MSKRKLKSVNVGGGDPCCNKKAALFPHLTAVLFRCVPKALKINIEHQQFVHSKAEPTSNLTEKKITGKGGEGGGVIKK